MSSSRPLNEQPKEGLFKNILSTGFSMFSKAVGTSKVERRAYDADDEKYKLRLDTYNRNLAKLKDVSDSVQVILNASKEQAENMGKISSIIS